MERPHEKNPPRSWDDWGPQEQARALREALGQELYDWLEREAEKSD